MAEELILIVEDNEKSRRLLRDLLQVNGYQTLESETAEEGIQIAQRSQPALVLMDIQLAGHMDGVEAARVIGERFGVPVVYLTANSDQATFGRAAAARPTAIS